VKAVALFTLLLGLAAADRAGGSLEGCVRLYANGDYAGAVRCAAAIEPAELNKQASRAVREASPAQLRQRLRLLAALEIELRIDAGALMACATPELLNGFPSSMARKRKPAWVERLELAGDGRAQGGGAGLDEPDWVFLKQWHLLATAYNQGHGYVAAAKACLESASAELRDDPEMKLAEGALSEVGCSRCKEGLVKCADAERSYRAALKAAPETTEARLRLGKVLIEQGRASEALTLLEPLNLVEQTRTRYLARMFSALAHERADELSEAQHFYELAEHVGTTASSTIGLATLAYRAGDGARARALLSRKKADASDPWLAYGKGIAWNAAAYLAKLRALTTQS
jgi:Tfp pilus assembly protein PilF